VTRDLLYGRRPVREALRGRREVLELWVSERALAAEDWLREAVVRVQVKLERELTDAAGTHGSALVRFSGAGLNAYGYLTGPSEWDWSE